MLKLAILGSTRGSSLTPIVDAIQQGQLQAQINIVISNKSDALILKRAVSYGLSTAFLDPAGLSREAYDRKLSDLLHQHHIDLIILIGYMRIISAEFVQEWKNKIINVHPSLLPAFAGKMDLAVHEAVLTAGVKETGCTVHYVTEEVDAGPVIVQLMCDVLTDDTAEQLKARVQHLEGVALVKAIATFTN